jgi:NAD kinase
MDRISENKIVLIIRNTRLDDLLARFNTIGQAKFYIEHLGADFSDYQQEHERYGDAVRETESVLRRLGRLHVLNRAFLPNYIFGADDTVVVLGQDGLVANTVKYLTGQPVIGVNPDRARWDGVLLPFVASDLPKIVLEVFSGKRRIKEVTMAKARLNNGQTLYAVNDLFIGVKSHVSARYVIRIGGQEERQSSSGIIVSTGLGGTGWFRSLVTGAAAVAARISRSDWTPPVFEDFTWDAPYLYYTVREPFPSRTSAASLVFGAVTPDEPLVILSQTPEAGVIFSDGIENDFLEFNSGTYATITVAEKRGRLVV